MHEGGGYFIFITRHEKALQIPVEVLSFSGKLASIKAQGVDVSDRVIIKGQARLKSGQKVHEVAY